MRGRGIGLSPQRKIICDLLEAARGVPTVPVQRRMNLARLVAARKASPGRPSWLAIFTRAYARVAGAVPELRRAYVKFPWPHLYEFPASIASIAFERVCGGENSVLIGRVKDPARRTLDVVDRKIRAFQEVDVERCTIFKRTLRIARLPRVARRLLWWASLNIGRQRGNHLGTFGVTAYSALGAESLHPISPLTTTLTYGVIAPDGGVDVRIVYDHRVLDGATVARALAALEAELNGATCEELERPTEIKAVA